MDYLVDLRPKSKTFGRWTKIRLSSLDPSCLIIPKGVAHGYQTLEVNTTVLYGIDVKYNPKNQKVLSIFDEDLSIKLELEINEIAERDLSGLSLKEATRFFENT
jgi:dTDP-4-dehydrorhamnose 3,5-epimerase